MASMIARQFLQRTFNSGSSSSASRLIICRDYPFCNYGLFLKHSGIRSLSSSSSPSSKPIYDYSSLDSGDRTIIRARGLLGIKAIPSYILRKSSIFLYESCTDKVEIERFMKRLNLEDTLSMWFCVTRLHVWMVSVRCMKEGKPNGEILRNELIARMWDDTSARVDKLGGIKTKLKNTAMKTYYDEFNATLLALDEGMLTDDQTLASALWRTLFGMNKDPNAEHLSLMVDYVRAQLEHLHRSVRSDQLLFQGLITWKLYPPLMWP